MRKMTQMQILYGSIRHTEQFSLIKKNPMETNHFCKQNNGITPLTKYCHPSFALMELF